MTQREHDARLIRGLRLYRRGYTPQDVAETMKWPKFPVILKRVIAEDCAHNPTARGYWND